MEISIGYNNVELTNVLANDDNFRPLFESKDDLGRTFIQEYLYKSKDPVLVRSSPQPQTGSLYKSRFSVVSFHLRTLLAKKVILQVDVVHNKSTTTSHLKHS